MEKSRNFYVSQSINFDNEKYSEKELNFAIECHKSPDPYLIEDSFPGSFKWEMTSYECKDGHFSRELVFTFCWENEEEINNWCHENGTSVDDNLLPSYILGTYESLEIGDDIYDYESSYDTY